MTCGIYALIFDNCKDIYIGQSKTIERRFSQHKTKLRAGSVDSPKLQNAFNIYGTPELLILQECPPHELSNYEKSLISEYDTYNKGLNGTPGGLEICSTFNTCKTKRPDIQKCFFLLLDTSKTIQDIFIETGVSKAVIREVSRLANHRWLKDLYPDEYFQLERIKNSKVRLSRKNSQSTVLCQSDPTMIDHIKLLLQSNTYTKDIVLSLGTTENLVNWVKRN